mgnify:CR=1 FL=1
MKRRQKHGETKQRLPNCSVSADTLEALKAEVKRMGISSCALIEVALMNFIGNDLHGSKTCKSCGDVTWSDDAGALSTLYHNSSDGKCDACGAEGIEFTDYP